MSRHERRSAIAEFRRSATYLETFLLPPDTNLHDHAVLRDAVLFWQSNRTVRKPMCIGGCKARFVDASTEPAAYLFATSPGTPGAASVSVFCAECWQTLPMCEIEANATRVFRRLLPGGRFEALRGGS